MEKVAAVAVKTALEFLEKENKDREKRKHDRRLRNIKLLLRNYRSFVNHCQDIKLDIQILNDRLELEELDTDEFAIESIKRSKERTLVMVRFINQMMNVYKIMSEQSHQPEDYRRYQVVYGMYVSEDRLTVDDISAMHNISRRTVYVDIDKACETLSVLMFGIDGIKLYR